MANLLTLLRKYNVSHKEIVESNGQVLFGDESWPKNAKTNYIIHGSGKKGSPKDYYTLGCLLFLLKNRKLSHPDYVHKAAAENIQAVRRPDRKDILAFLNGERGSSASIDKSAPLEIPTKIKRSSEENIENCPKKPCLEKTIKTKELLTASLDVPKKISIQHENVKSLSETMSAEKIAEIKAKRMAKKQMTTL